MAAPWRFSPVGMRFWSSCVPCTDSYRQPNVSINLLASLNLPPSFSLSLPERQREKMTPRPAMIRELCVLLEGFPSQPLASVFSQSLLSTWSMHSALGGPPYVRDLWKLLCYSQGTHSWPCAKSYYGPRGQCLVNIEKIHGCVKGVDQCNIIHHLHATQLLFQLIISTLVGHLTCHILVEVFV